MVKADAYGMGMPFVARALRKVLAPEGPWAFGVAAVCEGEALRATGWGGRIVVFSPVPPGEYPRAARAGVALALSDLDAVHGWAEAARTAGEVLPFHLEIDTGMGRSGFPWERAGVWGTEVERVAGDRLCWEGTFTHFHSADEPDLAPTDAQWGRFREALRSLPSPVVGVPRRVTHVANSAAALRRDGYACDLVRPGIALYGGSTGPDDRPVPVASLRARVALLRDVAPGATVGYGATYTARRPERWATLAIGYGDGLPRALGPAGGRALLCGQAVPIIGRISMDVAVVDVTGVAEVAVGQIATLIGRDGQAEITVSEVAERCGTIAYEILAGLMPRLPRVYLGSDAPAR